MRFINFIKRNLKVTIILAAIMAATIVGVIVVSADSSASITLGQSTITFDSTNMSTSQTVSITYTSTSINAAITSIVEDENVCSAYVSSDGRTLTVAATNAGNTVVYVNLILDNDPAKTYTAKLNVYVELILTNTDGLLDIHDPNNGAFTLRTNAAEGSTVTWTSSNESIATVAPVSDTDSTQASVTPLAAGSAIITAKLGGYEIASLTYVTRVPVSITDENATVGSGDGLVYIANNGSADASSSGAIYWWSEDESIATVTAGFVQAVHAGYVYVWASSKDDSAAENLDPTTYLYGDRILIYVPFEISDGGVTTVQVGDKFMFDTNGRAQDISLFTDDPNTIAYDETEGVFIAVSPGEATCTAAYKSDSSMSVTRTITVLDGLSLDNNNLALSVGESGTISIVSTSDEPVVWSIAGNTDEVTYATINPSSDTYSCTITGAYTTGNAYVTVTASQQIEHVIKSATARVYVLTPVDQLTLLNNSMPINENTEISIEEGNNMFIQAYLNMDSGTTPSNNRISWKSSDESVITLTPGDMPEGSNTQLCEVKAVGGGHATLTAVAGGIIATARFYVTEGVTGISLSDTDITVKMALSNYQLTATITPATDGVDKTVIWSTLDPKVVTVDQNGLVTLAAPGTTYVIATSAAVPAKTANCKITVIQEVQGVTMDYDSITMNVGDESRLTALVTPSNSYDPSVTWSSSDESVAKVDGTGLVTAVKSGSATIVVQTNDGGFIDMTNVKVIQPVTGINISSTEMSVKKGAVFYLGAEVLPSTADNKGVVWSSSDTSILTVDQSGCVTAVNIGTATIACASADSGVTAYCVVEVTSPVTGLELNINENTQTLNVGDTFAIVPTVLPLDAADKSCTFLSSDPTIATVDENGIVVAIKGGTCEVVVTTNEGGLSDKCKIIVIEKVSTVDISGEKEYLNVGESLNLTAAVTTDTATDKKVVWTSNKPTVATVDQNGKVTAIREGDVVITATANDGGGATDSVVIKCIIPVTNITLSDSKITIFVGDTYNITATITPANASVKDLEWTSDDPAIAAAYSNGDVVGMTAGRTVVHAKSTDSNEIIANCTVIVKNPIYATSVHINSSQITMLKGKMRQLTANMYPRNTVESLYWESSDTSVVQVDPNGWITTVGSGEAEIRAYSSYGTVYDTCTVNVIAMSFTSIGIEQYDTFQLHCDGAPETVSWRTSNSRIATVDQNGLVTGRMPGECTIYATVDNKTVSCFVKIYAIDPGKFINSDE